jgi:hypothetical protein
MVDNIEQEATEQTEPTPEQMQLIRTSMLEMMQKNYRNFMDSLREFPIHPQAMHQAFLFLDTGSLWMKEAIAHAPLIQKEAPKEHETPIQ